MEANKNYEKVMCMVGYRTSYVESKGTMDHADFDGTYERLMRDGMASKHSANFKNQRTYLASLGIEHTASNEGVQVE